jgi:hypothetical protein
MKVEAGRPTRISGRTLIILVFLLILLIMLALIEPLRSIHSFQAVEEGELYRMGSGGAHVVERSLDWTLQQIWGDKAIPPFLPFFGTSFAGLHQDGRVIMGENIDGFHGPFLMVVETPRDGYASIAIMNLLEIGITRQPGTFLERLRLLNAWNRPQDGMNQAGLAISTLYANCRVQGVHKTQDSIRSGPLVREILNQAEDVEQAITITREYDIWFDHMCAHHHVVDRNGDSAVLEFIDGELIVTRSPDPWQVATNFLHVEWQPEPGDAPCWRYQQAIERLEEYQGKLTNANATSILQEIEGGTKLSIVFNLTEGVVLLRPGGMDGRSYRYRFTEYPPAALPEKVAGNIGQ